MANNATKIWELMGINIQDGTGTYKNRMGISNAITRDNGVPLELSSYHATYNDAIVYAATSSIAYIDQILTAEGMLYIITEESQGKKKIGKYRDSLTGKIINNGEQEYDIYIKPIGIIPTGDNASIVVNGDGLVELFDFDGAGQDSVPVKENGKLVWKTLTDIGAKDGNTTYEFTLNDDGVSFTITPFFNGEPIYNGEEQTKYQIDFDVYTKKQVDDTIDELSAKIGTANEEQNKPLYDLIADEVYRADQAEIALSNRIGYQAIGNSPASGVYAYIDGVINSVINGVDAEKIDSLKDVIEWVEEHPLMIDELNDKIDTNSNAIEELSERLDNLTIEGEVVEIVEGEGIDIKEGGNGKKIVSIEKGSITDEYISSVSINKLIQDDNIVLILNGGKAK